MTIHHRIGAKIEQRMGLVEAFERQFAAAHATAAKLRSALVAELRVQCLF